MDIFNGGAVHLEWAIAESDSVSEDEIQLFYDSLKIVHQCENSLNTSLTVCELLLGVPIEHTKTVGPFTCMKYFGLNLNSELLKLRLPADEQDRVSKALSDYLM